MMPIMAQKWCYLPLIEVQVEILYSNFAIRIYLVKVINGDSCNVLYMSIIVRELWLDKFYIWGEKVCHTTSF